MKLRLRARRSAGLGAGGKQNVERGALVHFAEHANVAVVFPENSPGDGQAKSGAVIFGGEERLEQML